MSKLNYDIGASTSKPRSQRDLLSQLKSLVAASGNEKKFLLAHDALNVEKIGRTTVYDALHGRKIGPKLAVLLDKIKVDQEAQLVDVQRNGGVTVRNSTGGESLPGPLPKVKKTRATTASTQELGRPVISYVKQLQSLIAQCGSERKFFFEYARFNLAGAVRSSVYTLIHDGKVRPALALMLDAIAASCDTNNTLTRTQAVIDRSRSWKDKAVHGVEVLPKDDFAEGDDAGN